jgi:hypothetical protein
MVERKMELKRRYHLKIMVWELMFKLATAAGPDREKIVYKIKRLSPFWTEASLTQNKQTVATASTAERKPSRPKSAAGGGSKGGPPQKGPPKPKADKN